MITLPILKSINLEAKGYKLFVDGMIPEIILAVGIVALGFFFVWLKWGRK